MLVILYTLRLAIGFYCSTKLFYNILRRIFPRQTKRSNYFISNCSLNHFVL